MRFSFVVLLLLALGLETIAAEKAKKTDDSSLIPKKTDDSWMQEYYQHPQPERFEAEVKKLQASGALRNEGGMAPVAAFFSRLFQSAPPAQLAQWLKLIKALPDADQQVFLVALRWGGTRETQDALRAIASGKGKTSTYAGKLLDSNAPVLDKISNPTPEELDLCWGAFFATGSPEYALPVIRCATKPTKDREFDLSQAAARWSLKSLCNTHKKLRDIKDSFYKTALPEERKSLDKLFNK